MRAIGWGLAASFFFAFTFILNRMMQVSGGDWIWSASLRFFWMVPMLLAVVAWQRKLGPVLADLRGRPGPWLVWSTVGFGLFYAPLCYAAASGPAWLVAGTWQLTILAGMALAPLLREPGERSGRVPLSGWAFSGLILLGVLLIQRQQAHQLTARELMAGLVPVCIAAFAFPLGNRAMMRVCASRLDAVQRVLGMTLASLPFWAALSLVGVLRGSFPTSGQLAQTGAVALCSGVIATVLFFAATNTVKDAPRQLAAVEATQAGEVVFSAVGEALVLEKALPAGAALGGLSLVAIGVVLHALCSRPAPRRTGALDAPGQAAAS
jgi:drug/metabolite transporter (DMT)-like permease